MILLPMILLAKITYVPVPPYRAECESLIAVLDDVVAARDVGEPLNQTIDTIQQAGLPSDLTEQLVRLTQDIYSTDVSEAQLAKAEESICSKKNPVGN